MFLPGAHGIALRQRQHRVRDPVGGHSRLGGDTGSPYSNPGPRGQWSWSGLPTGILLVIAVDLKENNQWL